ncbi:hypothetical protein [Butyrivibrio sp. INlla14]|uniref:hypothetical protein n=1 Tax=Butyrivibrio sp. INlla14 TaxID=1520808 RepID=UPI0008772BFC|nr:hypothetical protein [Butyrivibrio sp. INlla14]SCY73937.1 hypothetical protein SAMN02910371_03669 [Butyrivibrio sp. INlla14]
MQLLGYHLILHINEHITDKKYSASEEDAKVAIKNAIYAYEQKALKPLLDEMANNEKTYLLNMAKCLDNERLADTSAISQRLGVTINKLSKQRANLIDRGIIAAPEHGKVMFCVPYLADYVQKEELVSDVVTVARQRRV